LDQRDGAAVGLIGLESSLAEQVARDHTVHHLLRNYEVAARRHFIAQGHAQLERQETRNLGRRCACLPTGRLCSGTDGGKKAG
jgi:hypothetical protein